MNPAYGWLVAVVFLAAACNKVTSTPDPFYPPPPDKQYLVIADTTYRIESLQIKPEYIYCYQASTHSEDSVVPGTRVSFYSTAQFDLPEIDINDPGITTGFHHDTLRYQLVDTIRAPKDARIRMRRLFSNFYWQGSRNTGKQLLLVGYPDKTMYLMGEGLTLADARGTYRMDFCWRVY